MGAWQRAAFEFAVDGAVAAASAVRRRNHDPFPPSPIDGVNDWTAPLSAQRPRPVVLVHGTGVGVRDTWDVIAAALVADGYRVFAVEHGRRRGLFDGNLTDRPGGGDIADSAIELSGFVESVRRATGAERVDIVAHSMGGVVARQYLRFSGGADPAAPENNKVGRLVMLGATNHGITFGTMQLIGMAAERLGLPLGALSDAALGRSLAQQMVGSSFLDRLNEGGDTVPGVQYTVVASRDDQVSTPPERTFLAAGEGARVRNIWVQDIDPSAQVDHMQLCTHEVAVDIVREALGSAAVGAVGALETRTESCG
ncbi:alpha/beta fold hydrolase [Tomitella cavernea]|uniref:Alpha/beta fold hydrolase n=2 Tax=Tomitella cavernea TaxID=1387982 RepID=A0ABP9CA89_9ACTN